MLTADQSLAARAAWLSYIGGFTQEEIAGRLGISRVKVNRLIAEANEQGLVRVFVQGTAAECIALENTIAERWKLTHCSVVPLVDDETLPLRTLAAAGALYLRRVLEQRDSLLIGMGHGRTLVEVVKSLPRLACPHVRFVSLLGSLTRHAAANPFDVIHRLTDITGAESYFMPAPFFADSLEDKAVLMAQKGLKDVLALARSADLYVVGIGEIGPRAHMLATGTITPREFDDLQSAGAVGEILGRFLDAQGRQVGADINERAVAIALEEIQGKNVVAIAGGSTKVRALASALESGVITGLITDEATAQALVQATADKERPEQPVQAQGKQPKRRLHDVRKRA